MLCLLVFGGGSAWATKYELVTSASQLVAGCNYIIADGTSGSVNVISTESNANNRRTTSGTVANSAITATDAMMVFELGGSSNAWTFTTTNYLGTDGFLYNNDTSNNRLKVGNDTKTNKFTISFTNNAISSITCNDNTSKGVMCFNGELVACYSSKASTYKVPQLYKESSEVTTEYNVTISNSIQNGSVSASVTKAEANATVTLTATPASGYKFDSWNVTNASTSVAITVTNNQFTMPAADVNVSASFSEIQKYTITWSVNGNTSTIAPTLVEDGENITFPTGLDDIYGKKFVGWTANEKASAASDLVSENVPASADVTFYAVFADVTAGGQTTATLSLDEAEDVSYTKGLTRTDDKGNDWVSYACVTNQKVNDVVHRYLQISKNSNGYYIGSPDFGSNIKAISAVVWNTSSSTREAYLKKDTQTKQPSVSDFGTTSIPANTKGVKIDLKINDNAEFSQFFIYSSAAIGFEWLEVTYGEADVVSGYCTTVAAPTYSEAKALNVTADNGKDLYFTTFSSDKVAFFPEYDKELTFATAIKTAMVDDTEFILEKIAKGTATIGGEDVDGFFVPANTGVLVQVEYDGKTEKNVPYYEVENMTVAALENNDFQAGNGEKLPEGKVWYKLAWADSSHTPSTLGFYYGAADGAPFTSTKGKAYLGLTPEQAAKKISFSLVDNEATSIKAIETVNGTSAVYNLAGQRVAPNAKGIVIVNGKKFINK